MPVLGGLRKQLFHEHKGMPAEVQHKKFCFFFFQANKPHDAFKNGWVAEQDKGYSLTYFLRLLSTKSTEQERYNPYTERKLIDIINQETETTKISQHNSKGS